MKFLKVSLCLGWGLELISLLHSHTPLPVQEKKVVILLTGRYAGKKAVIIRNHDDGTTARKYGHAEVLVLTKEPRKVSILSEHHGLPAASALQLQELCCRR